MRIPLAALGLATLMSAAAGGSAQALPGSPSTKHLLPNPAEQVRVICDPQRCYDPQTGAYGQSGCNARGCYPIGPAIGRLGPDGNAYGSRRSRVYRDDYDDDYEPRPRRRSGYSQGYGGGYAQPYPNVQIVPMR